LENGGWIIDTPGIRAFGLSHLNKDRMIESFPDIYQVTQTCMPNCSHHEVSCSLNRWIESDAALKVERLRRVTSLRSLLEVKLAEDEG
jgi:ribosome biogenesis GTPase